PPAFERLLARHAELAGPRPGGEDDGGRADVTGVGDDDPVAAARLDAPHLAHRQRSAGLDDLLLHPRAELETWHPFRETRKVLDALRVQDRAAPAERIEHERGADATRGAGRISKDRTPPVARGEEGCGEPRRPSARYCDLVVRHALLQQVRAGAPLTPPPTIRSVASSPPVTM